MTIIEPLRQDPEYPTILTSPPAGPVRGVAAPVSAGTDPDVLMRRHFEAQDDRPADWRDLHAAELSPYHRSLLMNDGTVTRLLEAFALEPIAAVGVSEHEPTTVQSHNRWLDVRPEDEVVARYVDLVGMRSGTRYLRAESLIVMNRLPAGFRDALQSQAAGIGAALQAMKAEPRRQLLYFGGTFDSVCARSYRIIVRGVPSLVINEWFLQ
ncbi:chorismate--pyruvate lyase family protein [Nocardia sp. KC 131]|uniref:chorismate--pyruvate lyase family protein n=1 Tax=Nocardia arseniciresistens TaxID=3392119 RepID=UPI00398E821C